MMDINMIHLTSAAIANRCRSCSSSPRPRRIHHTRCIIYSSVYFWSFPHTYYRPTHKQLICKYFLYIVCRYNSYLLFFIPFWRHFLPNFFSRTSFQYFKTFRYPFLSLLSDWFASRFSKLFCIFNHSCWC